MYLRLGMALVRSQCFLQLLEQRLRLPKSQFFVGMTAPTSGDGEEGYEIGAGAPWAFHYQRAAPIL